MMVHRKHFAVALTSLALLTSGCSETPDSLLTKAREAIAKKEPKAAEIHLKNLLQIEERADARFLLGQVHASNQDNRAAEKEFQRAFDGGFDRTQAGMELAQAQFSLGEHAKVIELARRLYPSDPADIARISTLIGRALRASGKRDEAEQAFKAAIAAVPDYPSAQVGLIALAAPKDPAAASLQIDQLLVRAPHSTEAKQLKADLALAQGHTSQAAALYAEVATGEPQNRAVRAKLAAIAIEEKNPAGAQRWIDELKKLTGPAAITMHLQALNEFRQGKNEAARDSILAGLKNGPGHPPSLALAASIFLTLNGLEQAETNARALIEKAPGSTAGYRLLGATYLRMNAPDRALQAVLPAVDAGAKDPMLLNIAGEAALKLNEADKAAAYFGKATALAPDDPAQRTGRGLAKIAAGDKEGGLSDLQAAADLPSSAIAADLALITQMLRDKQWDQARGAIDKLDSKRPNNALTSNLRGSVSLAKGEWAEARRHFEAALVLDPTFFAATANLVNLDLRDKKVEDARKRYLAVLDRDPRSVRAMLALAQLIQSTGGERKQVFEWLRKARETDRSSITATLALARFQMAGSDPKEALPGLQEAVAAAPDRIELLDALGTAYLRAGDEAQAISTFEQIIRLRPDSSPMQQRMGEFYAARKDWDRALKHLRKAVELAPGSLEPKLALAAAFASAGRSADARAIASALQLAGATRAAGAELEGDILSFERKPAEAIGAYRKALVVRKTMALSQKLHRALAAAGKEGEADALLKALIAENPQDTTARSYAAMWEISRQRWAQAIPLYREILSTEPDNALALNNLAWALHETRDPGALSTAEKAYAIAPTSAPVLDTYGTILLAQGQSAKAAEILRKAVTGAPKAHGFRVRLAGALIARGDKVEARKELDIVLAAVKSGPVLEQAQVLMRKL